MAADVVTANIQANGPQNMVATFTGFSPSGDGETEVVKVDASPSGPYGVVIGGAPFYPETHLTIMRVAYTVWGQAVRIQWEADTPRDAIILAEGTDELDFAAIGGLRCPDDLPGATGSLLFTTVDTDANDTYFVALFMKKNIVTTVGALAINGAPVLTATQDQPYTGFTVHAQGGRGPYVYSVAFGSLPSGITLDADTGVVSGTPDTAGAEAGIVIRVTDATGRTADLASFTITVADPVEITGAPVLTATQNRPYTGFSAVGSEGTAPLAYSLHAGAWPAGIVLNSASGAVSGTPTAAGAQAGLVIRATDIYGSFADLAGFTLTVAEPVEISGVPVTTAEVDDPYAGFFAVGAEGTTPLVYSLFAGVLPTGITLDAGSGEVAGTPTAVETKTGITIRVTDAYGSVANLAAFQIAVGVTHQAVTAALSADIVLDSVADVVVGQTVTGAGIPAATTVLVINVLTVTLSAASTETHAVAIPVTFTA